MHILFIYQISLGNIIVQFAVVKNQEWNKLQKEEIY